ncbi:MAG: peptide deformylase [Phycisphaerales bacterium]
MDAETDIRPDGSNPAHPSSDADPPTVPSTRAEAEDRAENLGRALAASLQIVLHPAPVLREKTNAVDPADPAVQAVAQRMIELMHEAPGVGLAAPQVGLPWRMFVANAGEEDPVDRVFLNPRMELTAPDGGRSPMESMEEGCLSLPGIHVHVRRPVYAAIYATGLDGQPFSLAADGFVARVWQHEFDHLEATLIIDRMGPRDRLANRRALRDLQDAAG